MITNSYRLLLILIPFSAFIGSAISYEKVYLFHVVGIVCAAALALNFKNINVKRIFEKDKLFFWSGFIWLTLSYFWSENTLQYFRFLMQYVVGVFCFFSIQLLIRSEFDYKKVLKVLGYTYLAHLCFSLLEAFTRFRLPISPMSKYIKLIRTDELVQNLSYPSFYDHYPSSFFWHPNNVALVTLCALPIFLNNKKLKVPYKFALWGLALTVIVKAGAKAMLVLFTIYSFSLIYKSISNLQKLRPLILPVLFVSIISGTLFWTSLHPKQKHEAKSSFIVFSNYAVILPKFVSNEFFGTSFNLDLKEQTSERFLFMGAAINEYKKSPLLGIGAGQLYKKKVDWKGKQVDLNSIHNYWLEMLVIGGPLFFLGYLSWFVYVIFKLFKANTTLTKSYAEVMILFFFAAPVMSSVFYFLPKWLLYGLAVKSLDFAKQQEVTE